MDEIGFLTGIRALQVVTKMRNFGKKRDFLVLNFGLHFSETYREELEQLIDEVSTLPPRTIEQNVDQSCCQLSWFASLTWELSPCAVQRLRFALGPHLEQ